MTRRAALKTTVAAVAAGLGLGSCSPSGRVDGETLRYGSNRRQRIELSLPSASAAPFPVVVLIHGGFWRNRYDLGLMRPLVPALVANGLAVANIDYRSLGDLHGGWPATFEDVATAIDVLHDRQELDVGRVAAIGHSAGGQLAVWAAGRGSLPQGSPGSGPRVVLSGVVSQAGVLDLATAAEDRLGGGAVRALLGGGPAEVPDRYRLTSPIERLPLGVPVVAIHDPTDELVPFSQSSRYVATATEVGDRPSLVEVAGGHFGVIDPQSSAWRASIGALLDLSR
jgi:acetyl esterase/lipase